MASESSDISNPRVDIGAVRAKYRTERDRRLHVDGIRQYSPLLEDDSSSGRASKSPSAGHNECQAVDVVVIGAGIGGILAAVRLKQAGISHLRIIEKSSGVGGTWHLNRYPGVRCDIESYIYLPLLEETGYCPSEKYVTGDEIRTYLASLARSYALTDVTSLNTRVTAVEWLDNQALWAISTNTGEVLRTRFVVHAAGLFTTPKIPAVPGLEMFNGRAFHTSRWDYEYTGEDLSRLADKRVGIIGTGATAVQCVPPLAAHAQHLYVFQRTPSPIDERGNSPTDPEWWDQMPADWRIERMMNFTLMVSGHTDGDDVVDDGWTRVMRKVGSFFKNKLPIASPAEMAELLEVADFHHMEDLRRRVDQIVHDAGTAELLKPYYRSLCKRPCFSDDYLPAFNQPNVTLVDVSRDNAIATISDHGILTASGEYDLDCIIFATGFHIGTTIVERSGFDITGRVGLALSDKWKDGPRTLHGLMSHQFPNLFFLGAIQTGSTSNFTHMLYEQTAHMTSIIAACNDRGADYVEPTPAAEAHWVQTVRQSAQNNTQFLQECTPGYFNQEGDADDLNGLIASQYAGGPLVFFDLLEHSRKNGHTNELAFARLDPLRHRGVGQALPEPRYRRRTRRIMDPDL